MKFTVPRPTLFLLLGSSVWIGGCASFPDLRFGLFGRDSKQQVEVAPRAARAQPKGGGVQVVYLAFDLVSAEFLVEGVRHSRKVWNHVDEMRLDPAVSARLARNGLRIGVASVDAWPILGAIFDAAGADVLRRQLVAHGSEPMVIPMGVVRPGESIFSYAHNGRLTGKTFKGGDKLVIVDYSFRPTLGGATDLALSFEVRRTLDELTWQRVEGRIVQRVAVDRHVFDQLDVDITVATNEFLVFGVTDLVGTDFLVGSRFLGSSEGGERRERLYCITPVPIRASEIRGLGR